MTKSNLKPLLLGLLVVAGMSVTSCKNKSKDAATTTDTATVYTPPPTPVVISADDSLKNGVVDATKDFSGVSANVMNGEITLTGEIERSKLPTLMQSLNSLHPKKITNNLKVK